MAKLTLSDISSGHKAPEAINANNALIEAAVENTLSRDGTTPNQMNASLDMNGYSIVNASNSTIAASDLSNTVFVTTAADFKTQMESSSAKNVIVSSSITLTSAVNGHANSNLIVYSGGKIDGAYTLDLNKDPAAGLYQIFGSSITVTGITVAHPEWWGAVGDGATNDSLAIETACSSSSKVILTEGVSYGVLYRSANDRPSDYPGGFTSSAILLASNTTITGGGTLLLLDDTGHGYWSWAVFGTASDINITDFTLDGIIIDGAATVAKQKTIILEDFSRLTITNCWLKDIATGRIGHSDVATSSFYFKFTDNRLTDTLTLGMFYVKDFIFSGNITYEGISELIDCQAGCSRGVIADNHCVIDGGDSAIDINASEFITITGNFIRVTGADKDGILVNTKAIPPDAASPTNTGSSHIIISNNIITTEAAAIQVKPGADAAGFTIQDIIITGNNIKGAGATVTSGTWGIFCEGNRVIIADNKVENFVHGIGNNLAYTNQTTDDYKVTNNIVKDGSETGIQIKDAESFSINHNQLTSCADGGSTSSYNAIWANNVDASAHKRQIIGNIIDSGYQGIRVSGAVTGSLLWKDNQILAATNAKTSLPSDLTSFSGEVATVRVGTIAAGTGDELPVMAAESDSTITNWHVINASDITQSDTNYSVHTLRYRGDGTSTNTIANFSTQVTGGVAINSFARETPDATMSTTYRDLTAGDVVSHVKADSGSGAATDELIAIVEYITY